MGDSQRPSLPIQALTAFFMVAAILRTELLRLLDGEVSTHLLLPYYFPPLHHHHPKGKKRKMRLSFYSTNETNGASVGYFTPTPELSWYGPEQCNEMNASGEGKRSF